MLEVAIRQMEGGPNSTHDPTFQTCVSSQYDTNSAILALNLTLALKLEHLVESWGGQQARLEMLLARLQGQGGEPSKQLEVEGSLQKTLFKSF